jgi:hypothetical protein
MKFAVPLTMPWRDRIRFAARPSRSAPMIGTPARDRRLEAQEDAAPPRRLEQLRPVGRQERLVRGHDVLAGLEGAEHVGARRLEAADHLDDERHPPGRPGLGRDRC